MDSVRRGRAVLLPMRVYLSVTVGLLDWCSTKRHNMQFHFFYKSLATVRSLPRFYKAVDVIVMVTS